MYIAVTNYFSINITKITQRQSKLSCNLTMMWNCSRCTCTFHFDQTTINFCGTTFYKVRSTYDGKVNGKRGRGRPRTKRTINIEKLTGMGYHQAVKQTHDRKKWLGQPLHPHPYQEDRTIKMIWWRPCRSSTNKIIDN